MSDIADTRAAIVTVLASLANVDVWPYRPPTATAGRICAWPEFDVDYISGDPSLDQGMKHWSACVFLAEAADNVHSNRAISPAQSRADELCERDGLGALLAGGLHGVSIEQVTQEMGAELGDIPGILVKASVIILAH